MANVIVNRVKEFLKIYPPFTFLSDNLLEIVAEQVDLVYLAQGDYVFHQGTPAKNHFYIVKEGVVNLTEELGGNTHIREFCDEGDVFGVLALLGKRPYILNAYAAENTMLYAIPVGIFEKILEENSQVSLYFAAGFASGQVVVRSDLTHSQVARRAFSQSPTGNGIGVLTGQSPFRYTPDVLTCRADEPVVTVAKKMSDREVGSIVVVDDDHRPLGIITDKDLRNRLVAKGLSANIPVSEIMTSPTKTIGKESDFTSLYLTMIKNRLHHLIITEDGTTTTKVAGIVSDHDVLLSQGYNPAIILHALMNTVEVSELADLRNRTELLLEHYIENEVALDFVANVITEINDVITQRALVVAKHKLDKEFGEDAQVPFCFITLGSQGRKEQLLRTDMDNAIVYADVAIEHRQKTKDYFLALAQDVIATLKACGFQPCPHDIMATNPDWCQPLSQWKKYFESWVRSPRPDSLLKASIFFDFRAVFGDKDLTDKMTGHINELIKKDRFFLRDLATNALMTPPPLGFFRNFLVEKSGEHRDKFDIKLRAMMPLIDAARLLSLSYGRTTVNNSFQRLEMLAEKEPHNREVYLEAGRALEIFMRFRVVEGLKMRNSGRFIQPDGLGKLQRQLLKNAFIPINDIQQLIKARFRIEFLGG